MSEWKPKPKSGLRYEGLNLTGEEGFVLSRLDGVTSLRDVTHVTGLPEGRVRQILDKLVEHGAVEADRGAPPAAAPRPAARAPTPAAREALAAARDALLDDPSADVHADGDPTLDDEPPVMEPVDEDAPTDPPQPAPAYGGAREDDVEQDAAPTDPPAPAGDDDGPTAHDTDESKESEKQRADQQAEEKAEDDAAAADEGNFRQLYETELATLELPEREALARTALDPQLSALCFDAHPNVIKGVLENPKVGFPHARLVARHHRTPQGLDFVLNRAEFFRDTQTQRLMLANPMLQDAQLRRLLGNKRLAEIYKTTLNRDLPERNRQKARQVLRTKWSSAEGEERAGLVLTTEGRCLMQLTGLPFDSKTTSILCSKTYNSTLMIQNVARFAATPPNLLQHLARQAVVRRMPQLRTIILQHPNCPAEVKRKG